ADRLVEVIPLHEDREETRNRAAAEPAGPLEDPGQQVEHRRGVAFLAGRLPGSEPDLTLRHGKPGDGVHYKKHVAALVTEVLRDCQCNESCPDAERSGAVGGGHDDDGALQALGTKLLLQEVPHLAIALPDQRDHTDVRGVLPGHRAQQGAFADAASAEYPDALSLAAGEQAID